LYLYFVTAAIQIGMPRQGCEQLFNVRCSTRLFIGFLISATKNTSELVTVMLYYTDIKSC